MIKIRNIPPRNDKYILWGLILLLIVAVMGSNYLAFKLGAESTPSLKPILQHTATPQTCEFIVNLTTSAPTLNVTNPEVMLNATNKEVTRTGCAPLGNWDCMIWDSNHSIKYISRNCNEGNFKWDCHNGTWEEGRK